MDAPGQEVSQINEFAVPFILDVDHAPAVLPPTYGLPFDDHVALRADHSERDHVLRFSDDNRDKRVGDRQTYPDLLVELDFLVVVLVCVKRVQTDVVIYELSPDLEYMSVNTSAIWV